MTCLQEETCKLVIRARTTEGDHGDVTLTVVNKSVPRKNAQVIKFKIRPLSLHNRVHDDDTALPKLDHNSSEVSSTQHTCLLIVNALYLCDVPVADLMKLTKCSHFYVICKTIAIANSRNTAFVANCIVSECSA
jgi:hypothetical protein